MNLLEYADEVIVNADGRKLLLKEFESHGAPGPDKLNKLGFHLLFMFLNGMSPFVASLGLPVRSIVMNEFLSVLVAAVAVPCHGGVILKPVEPAPDERVAGLHLVVQESEG